VPGFRGGAIAADGQWPDHCGQAKGPHNAQQQRPQRGATLGKCPHGLNRGGHRLERNEWPHPRWQHSNRRNTRAENTRAMDGIASQNSAALLFARTAIAITAVEKTTTTSTGTSKNGITASQPPSNRSPSPTPTAVIRAAPTSVRAASASSLPTRALARFTGNTHN
jgi:hypothetical protein